MTNEEFRAGWNAGKRNVLMRPKPGTSWNNNGEMNFLCNTVQTLKKIDLDFGSKGVLIYMGKWLVSENDFVKFVDDEIKEHAVASIILDSIKNKCTQITFDDAVCIAKKLLKAGYISSDVL